MKSGVLLTIVERTEEWRKCRYLYYSCYKKIPTEKFFVQWRPATDSVMSQTCWHSLEFCIHKIDQSGTDRIVRM